MKSLVTAFVLGALLCAPFAFGQATDGNVVGTVVDATGAAVPNAGVELANVATAVKSTTKTDAAGEYRFGNVPVGKYNITVTAQGFTTSSLHDVAIELNKTTTANVSLTVGGVATQIEVVEAPTLLDTTTAQITNTYETKLMAELPLASNPTGGIYNLALIGAGVSSSGGVGVGYGPAIGGQRPRNNNFTVDGVDNNRKDITGPVIFLPNDSVAEATVLQNQFSAEFGHSSGGQFNAVIKSGTNEVHGSVYEYLENRKMFANDQAAARQGILSPPRYDQNRLGGAAGGPIKKNKWFVFGNFEYNPIGQASVPSAPVYAPTQAGYSLLDSMAGISKTNLGILEKYAPATATQVKTTPVNGVNIPLGVYQIVSPSFQNNYNWLISSDFSISEKDQLRGRYISNKVDQLDTNASLPIFFYPEPQTSKLASLSEFHNFRPNLLNEIRLAANRFNQSVPVPNSTYPGLDVFPNVVMRNDLNLNIGPDPNGPQSTIQTTYQIADNVSWTKGRHDFKFGFDGRDLIAASTFIQRVRGDYEWTTLSGFLNDTFPDFIAQRNPGGRPYSGNDTAYYFFANDNWRLNPHLTLNLGVRYEFDGVAQSMRLFRLNSIADVPGVLTFAAPQAAKNNWSPRIGVAYSPGNTGRTSFRAGFGTAYDQIFDNVGTNATPPQASSTVDVTGLPGSGFLAKGGILPSAVPSSFTPLTARVATSSFLPPNQQLGYAITWNAGVQHTFANDYTAEVRYVGTKGVHLLFQNQLNRNALISPTSNLPTYMQMPSQATLNSLTVTTAALANIRATCNVPSSGAGYQNCDPRYDPIGQYGFVNAITGYVPRGNSNYHGLALELKKRYTKNLLFDAAYTWSHLIDDSTAEVNSIVATPRRPQDFNNLSIEKSNSALDHRHRFTYTAVYGTPWYSNAKNALVRNTIGNWQAAGTYTIEAGEWATPQSGVDSNQNGDAAGDRAIINPSGVKGTSSDVTALKNTAGATVAYLVNNPNAEFIRAQVGAFATGGRNILATPKINNVDFTISKNLTFKERYRLQLRADMYNALNHPQYTLGRIDNVRAKNTSGSANWFIPGNPAFAAWDQSFSSNPRTMQVSAKVTF
jgi:hypothetical protein